MKELSLRVTGTEPGELQSMGREELDPTELLHFHFLLCALEKEMATLSSVLAWESQGRGNLVTLTSRGRGFSGVSSSCGVRGAFLTMRDRKSTRLNSSHSGQSRMPSSA